MCDVTYNNDNTCCLCIGSILPEYRMWVCCMTADLDANDHPIPGCQLSRFLRENQKMATASMDVQHRYVCTRFVITKSL